MRGGLDGRETAILKNISFSAISGEVTTIIGPSGGGKSSLIRLINRLSEPTCGRVLLARLRGIGQERQMLWSSFRMVIQLLAVGYLLYLVFAVRSPLAVIAILLAMAGFSLQVMWSRIKRKMPHFYRVTGTALLIGCGGVTFMFCSLVINYSPWYDPRYLIPLAGI